MALLSISGLQVSVGEKSVLNELELSMDQAQVFALVGPNGSGKSSLANILIGNPIYTIAPRSVVSFEGKNLLDMDIESRVKAGLFVAWQNPMMIPGVPIFSMCKTSYENVRQEKILNLVEFKRGLEKLAQRVGLTKEHISREVNVGFSGGERKRLEMLQMLLLQPKLAILDEVDSGLDAKGVEILASIVNEMVQKGTSFLIISHNSKLLSKIKIDKTLEMKSGRLSAGI